MYNVQKTLLGQWNSIIFSLKVCVTSGCSQRSKGQGHSKVKSSYTVTSGEQKGPTGVILQPTALATVD